MSNGTGARRRDEAERAVRALQESGIEFRGPFTSSKGDLIVIGHKILMVHEVLELDSKGKLNPAGIQDFTPAD